MQNMYITMNIFSLHPCLVNNVTLILMTFIIMHRNLYFVIMKSLFSSFQCVSSVNMSLYNVNIAKQIDLILTELALLIYYQIIWPGYRTNWQNNLIPIAIMIQVSEVITIYILWTQ